MQFRSMFVVAVWVGGFALVGSGCGNGGGSDEVSDASNECVEGRTASCACEGDQTGVQICRPDGTWGPCDCSDTTAGDDIRPGMDGGDTGTEPPSDSAAGGDGVAPDTSEDDSPSALRSARGTSRFEEDVNIPDCAPSNDDVQIIDENSDWSTINGDSRIFCVRPGNYTSVGDIEVTASGSEGARRYLIFDGPSEGHPVDRPGDEQAVVQRLLFDGASYWTVDGIEVGDDVARDITGAVVISEGSDHNVFHRMVVGPDDNDWVDHALFEIYGSHNTLQNSVLGETLNWGVCAPIKAPGRNREVEGNKIVSNELFNCLDGVQLVVTVPDHSGTSMPGTVVAHNDMYFDENYYTDGNGNFDPDGDWNCGENGVDVKAGGEGAEPARVVGNRIWGMSNKDTDCQGAGGTPPAGASGINIHEGEDEPTVGVEVSDNIVFDTPTGIGVEHSDEIVVENNLIHTTGGIDGHNGKSFVALDTAPLEVRGNTAVDGRPNWVSFWESASGRFENNVVLRSGNNRSDNHGLTTSKNAYYASQALENDPWIEEGSASASDNDEFCVTLEGYTDPREKCFDLAVSTDDSPHGTQAGFTPP